MKPGLSDCPNAVIVPHIASASHWTRSGMVHFADSLMNGNGTCMSDPADSAVGNVHGLWQVMLCGT